MRHTDKQLRDIALNLLKGKFISDWDHTSCNKITTISEIESLIWETRDIVMIVAERENTLTKDKNGNPIFSTFQTLTKDEALQVADMYLRYNAFMEVDVEIEIPHERNNPYVISEII
jgi:hypothetical protein